MGTYGAFEGVTNKAVRGKSLKMKMNAVMNGSGLRGAKAGNGLGAMSKYFPTIARMLIRMDGTALFYCCGESFITWVRKTDGPENFILSGGLAGMLFKSTAGGRTSLVAGALGAGAAGLLEIGKEYGPEMPL